MVFGRSNIRERHRSKLEGIGGAEGTSQCSVYVETLKLTGTTPSSCNIKDAITFQKLELRNLRVDYR